MPSFSSTACTSYECLRAGCRVTCWSTAWLPEGRGYLIAWWLCFGCPSFARFHEAEHAMGWMGGVADNFRGVGDKYPVVLNARIFCTCRASNCAKTDTGYYSRTLKVDFTSKVARLHVLANNLFTKLSFILQRCVDTSQLPLILSDFSWRYRFRAPLWREVFITLLTFVSREICLTTSAHASVNFGKEAPSYDTFCQWSYTNQLRKIMFKNRAWFCTLLMCISALLEVSISSCCAAPGHCRRWADDDDTVYD